jgi:hypothetical protein
LRELSGCPVFKIWDSNLPEGLTDNQEALVRVAILWSLPENPEFPGLTGKDLSHARHELITREQHHFYDMFKAVGLSGSQGSLYVYGTLPEELQPFVRESKTRYTFRYISAAISNYIETPRNTVSEWHLGPRIPVRGYQGVETGESFRSLQPPGHYCGKDIVSAQEHNLCLLVDAEPGRCICCRGVSGERRHFGVIAFGPSPYSSNFICRACVPAAFEAWKRLLD